MVILPYMDYPQLLGMLLRILSESTPYVRFEVLKVSLTVPHPSHEQLGAVTSAAHAGPGHHRRAGPAYPQAESGQPARRGYAGGRGRQTTAQRAPPARTPGRPPHAWSQKSSQVHQENPLGLQISMLYTISRRGHGRRRGGGPPAVPGVSDQQRGILSHGCHQRPHAQPQGSSAFFAPPAGRACTLLYLPGPGPGCCPLPAQGARYCTTGLLYL